MSSVVDTMALALETVSDPRGWCSTTWADIRIFDKDCLYTVASWEYPTGAASFFHRIYWNGSPILIQREGVGAPPPGSIYQVSEFFQDRDEPAFDEELSAGLRALREHVQSQSRHLSQGEDLYLPTAYPRWEEINPDENYVRCEFPYGPVTMGFVLDKGWPALVLSYEYEAYSMDLDPKLEWHGSNTDFTRRAFRDFFSYPDPLQGLLHWADLRAYLEELREQARLEGVSHDFSG